MNALWGMNKEHHSEKESWRLNSIDADLIALAHSRKAVLSLYLPESVCQLTRYQ